MNVQINMNLKHLLILIAAIGIIVAAQAGTAVLRDTQSDFAGANFTTINISNPAGSSGLTAYKVGSFTRDISITGTQAVTGVGFKPKAVELTAVVSGTKVMSVGYTDFTSLTTYWDDSVSSADTYSIGTGNVVYLLTAAGTAAYVGTITADADGFTLTWANAASPTGTATINYIAYR